MTEYARALVWFRRALRDYDHAALYHALKRARQVVCAFVFDHEILDALADPADRRVEFIHASVAELQQALEASGGGLVVRHRKAMLERGAGEWPASISVWAMGMMRGALVNVVYPAMLMTKKRSWRVLGVGSKEIGFSLIVGLNLFLAFALWFFGMLLLGPMGGSVGFGIYFALQILGAQGLGLVSGEWRGVQGKPVKQMGAAVAILVVAAAIMAYASTMT